MNALDTTTDAPGVPGATDDITHGAVHLRVTDVGRAREFWGAGLGLTERGTTGGVVHLGTPARDLVVLHPGATRRQPRGVAGLYHLAVHVPTQDAFAATLLRLAEHRIPQAPTDHIFSIATYANDADGLGLEVTFETPWRVRGHELAGGSMALIDDHGRRRSPVEALDAPAIVDAFTGEPGAHIDADSAIGHIHLHVPDLAGAGAFYEDVVGFTTHMRMDDFGMYDFSAGGAFPHRMAVNEWQGRGVPPGPDDAAGLVHHELVVAPGALEPLAARLRDEGHPYARDGEAVLTRDPGGNRLRLTARAG